MTTARREHAKAIARELDDRSVDASLLTPGALAFLMFSTTLLLGREAAMGITEGHDEVRRLIDALFLQLG